MTFELLVIFMDTLFASVLADPCLFLKTVRQVQKTRQDEHDDAQRTQRADSEEVAELRDQTVSRQHSEQEADDGQDRGGGQDRYGAGCDCLDDRTASSVLLAVFAVAVREQDRVVDRRPELYLADDQVGDIEDVLSGKVRDRQVYPDRGFDPENQDYRQGN